MFAELASQSWTPSSASVVITNNTDVSIDGSSRKIVWTNAANGYVTISFTAVDLSAYEELSLYIYVGGVLTTEDFLTITIGSNVYYFSKDEFRPNKWNHILIDCANLGTVSNIRITSLISDLKIFVDYIGYRAVSDDCDVDIINALKDHINLDYDVETTLSEPANAGDMNVSLASLVYVTDTSVIELDDGVGTIEQVRLLDKSGALASQLVNSYDFGSTVRVVCPVLGEDYDDISPDPLCGIKVYDMDVEKQDTVQLIKYGSKIKQYLGALGILIYIDCESKKKLLSMSREFNRKYGKEFIFLLDGEQVEIFLDSSVFSDVTEVGNNPRMAYFYKLEPQPYIVASNILTTMTLTIESVSTEEIGQ